MMLNKDTEFFNKISVREIYNKDTPPHPKGVPDPLSFYTLLKRDRFRHDRKEFSDTIREIVLDLSRRVDFETSK